jgi:hypothetical protein
MASTIQKQLIDRPIDSSWQSVVELFERVSDWFWFLLSLSLFVVLGPFAAPVALIALTKLGLEENDLQEPESEV